MAYHSGKKGMGGIRPRLRPDAGSSKCWRRGKKTMSAVIWSMGTERFGKAEQRIKLNPQPKENRRLKEIATLRGDLRKLKKAFRKVTESEKLTLSEIRGSQGSVLRHYAGQSAILGKGDAG